MALLSAVLAGRNAIEIHVICANLFSLVELIVHEAVDKATEELKAAATMAAFDALDEQREHLIEMLTGQVNYPQ